MHWRRGYTKIYKLYCNSGVMCLRRGVHGVQVRQEVVAAGARGRRQAGAGAVQHGAARRPRARHASAGGHRDTGTSPSRLLVIVNFNIVQVKRIKVNK